MKMTYVCACGWRCECDDGGTLGAVDAASKAYSKHARNCWKVLQNAVNPEPRDETENRNPPPKQVTP